MDAALGAPPKVTTTADLILGNGSGEDEIGQAPCSTRSSPSFSDSPSDGSSSSGGRDQPPHRRARFKGEVDHLTATPK